MFLHVSQSLIVNYMFPSRSLWRIKSAFRQSSGVGQKVIIAGTLQLTNNCVSRLQQICKNNEFLRVAVEGGGCSGFQYTFQVDTVRNDDDKVFEKDGIKVIVDEVSLPFLDGGTLDYQEELIRSAFRIVNNPKAMDGCSCGTSFSVKE